MLVHFRSGVRGSPPLQQYPPHLPVCNDQIQSLLIVDLWFIWAEGWEPGPASPNSCGSLEGLSLSLLLVAFSIHKKQGTPTTNVHGGAMSEWGLSRGDMGH